MISSAVTRVTTPARRAITTAPESFATFSSSPVPTSGVRGLRSGTAWRCMFDPIRARTAEHELIDERAVGVQLRVRLRDRDVLLAVCVEPRDLVRHLAVLHDAVRRFDEPEVVHAREARERRDEADVRTFRRLDRAHAPVLRVVHVADFEAGALARETARAERRETAFVRQLGERVRLIHELRELRRS